MVKDHTGLLLDFTSAAEWLWTSGSLAGASTAVFSKIFPGPNKVIMRTRCSVLLGSCRCLMAVRYVTTVCQSQYGFYPMQASQ